MAASAERMTHAMRSLEAIFLIGVEGVTEIWLVRHGDCYQDMPEGRDPSLSTLGRDQAARLAERVRRVGFEAVYSSPYRRALETAQIVSDDVKVDPRLVEMELELGEGDQFDMKETPEDTVARMRAAIDEIVEAHPGKRVVVVGHGAAIVAYLTNILRLDPGELRILPYYTSVSTVRALGDLRMVGGLVDVAHLE